MKLTIEIELDNAAFQDGHRNDEVAEILEYLARAFKRDKIPNRVSDINGNTVGSVDIS